MAGAIGWLALMVLIGGRVAARRAFGLPRALPTATAAIAVGTAATLGALLALGVIATQARVVIPVGGMVVSGAMQATSLALTRLGDEVRTARPAIEARLSHDPIRAGSLPAQRAQQAQRLRQRLWISVARECPRFPRVARLSESQRTPCSGNFAAACSSRAPRGQAVCGTGALKR
jgi:Uncharacterised protein family (UPF0014)